MKTTVSLMALLLLLSIGAFAQITPAPQLINFQGRLANPNGAPVPDTNTLSITFSLWDAKDVGTGAKRWEQTVAPITVKSGLFSVLLDFATGFTAGANINTAFNGSAWLQIQVGTDSPLTPRQRLVSVAYALKANSVADGSVTNASIAVGTITADKFAANLFNTTAWLLNGNSGVTSGFLGTMDNQPLVFRVNNRQAMRYSYAENANFAYRSINVLGGSEINSIAAGAVGATIAGGGLDYFTLTDFPNRVLADFGTVGGGFGNTASSYATVGGGSNNAASGDRATVGGGRDNAASANATIGGGEQNIASGTYATVGGGYQSVASANTATIGGGASNFATSNAATVAGGAFNTASGLYAAVPGGFHNTAVGSFSFAAGQQAHADFIGSFVWNDASDTASAHPFASTAANQFLIRATGGVGIGKTNPLSPLDVQGDVRLSGAGNGLIFPDGTKQTTAGGSGGGNGWNLTGNADLNPATQFLGTTDNQPLVFKVNSRQAMRYSYAENAGFAYRSINVLGGSDINSISAGVTGATIAGGGQDFFTGTDYPNRVLADFGTVGGGSGNTANGFSSTVGGGNFNTVSGNGATVAGGDVNTADDNYATVGGGEGNQAQFPFAVIAGGRNNNASDYCGAIGGGNANLIGSVAGTALYATISGGDQNSANGGHATIGGGYQNTAGNAFVIDSAFATVGGGGFNTASGNSATIGGGNRNTASGESATVGGGSSNTASGSAAMVGGGYANTAAGECSFAAGYWAEANHDGAFVWADTSNPNAAFASTAANQFLIRATGGVGINTNNPAGFALNVNGMAHCPALTWSSDIRYKKKIASYQNALDAIQSLRGVTFDWRREEFKDNNFPTGHQIGFIAQEVEKVLPELVTTDANGYKSVAYANVVPVLVEAVKTQQKQIVALKKDKDGKQKQINSLRTTVEAVKAKNAELEARLTALAEAVQKLQNDHK